MMNLSAKHIGYVKTLWQEQLDDIRKYRREVLEKKKEESLHQLRIAIRRSIVLMDIFRDSQMEDVLKHHRKYLKQIITLSNTARDMDVMRAHIILLGQKKKKKSERMAALFDKRLAKRQKKAYKKLFHFLESDLLLDQLLSWESYLHTGNTKEDDITAAGEFKHITDAVIGTYFSEISKDIAKLRTQRYPETKALHKLRIAYKKLRYLLESFTHLYDRQTIEIVLKQMKKMQNVLGGWHDVVQQKHIVKCLIKEEKDRHLRYYLRKKILPILKKEEKERYKKVEKRLQKYVETFQTLFKS